MNKDGSTPLRELRHRVQRLAGDFVVAQAAECFVFTGVMLEQFDALAEAVWALALRENEVYGPPKGEGGA